MDTPTRLLRLLGLLAGRAWWSAADLAVETDVTERTVRRDITRLRDLGYPIEGTTGPYGGYTLGRGGQLPPLVLDDDEAVAVAVVLRQAASGGIDCGIDGGIDCGVEGGAVGGVGSPSAALVALTKLEQVLPAGLRERVAAVADMTVGLRPGGPPPADVDTLVAAALACRRNERLRFTYQAGTGEVSERLVEPLRLVQSDRRWYLVVFDPGRADWRTFRVDRMSEVKLTGARFAPHPDPPDPAALVARGLAVEAYPVTARVELALSPQEAAQMIPRTVAVLQPGPDGSTLADIGGDLIWLAHFLAGLECEFVIVDPPELVAELRRLGRRLAATRLAEPRAG